MKAAFNIQVVRLKNRPNAEATKSNFDIKTPINSAFGAIFKSYNR